MKKIFAAAFAAALILSAAGCGGESSADKTPAKTDAPVSAAVSEEVPAKEFAVKDVTDAILAELPIASAVEKTGEAVCDYIYDIDISRAEDSILVMCASGAYPDEIAVFKMKSEADAADALKAVEQRLKKQSEIYETYTPEEFYKLDGAKLKQKGVYVYYLVTSDNDRAREIAEGFIG